MRNYRKIETPTTDFYYCGNRLKAIIRKHIKEQACSVYLYKHNKELYLSRLIVNPLNDMQQIYKKAESIADNYLQKCIY